MASEITQLSAIIQSSVQDLLALSSTNGWSLPELNKPFDPATQSFRANPDGARASAKIIAAAMQLATTLMSPRQSIGNTCVEGVCDIKYPALTSLTTKAAAERRSITRLLRLSCARNFARSGTRGVCIVKQVDLFLTTLEGLHVKKISERTGSRIDSAKLGMFTDFPLSWRLANQKNSPTPALFG
jgi:hypothetical protein